MITYLKIMSSFINIMEASQQESTVKDTPSEEPEQKTVDIMDMEITSENVALNVLVTFVNLAQKRGAFNIKESAKIWECIQTFQKSSQ
tara:strand:+ start:244 stop:507 length:264 start_codon:yes stop_codon:yes gene_type:complete